MGRICSNFKSKVLDRVKGLKEGRGEEGSQMILPYSRIGRTRER